MRIAVDAMGSDNAPVPDIEGAILAAREYRETIILVGNEALITSELAKHATDGLQFEVVHAPQTITMEDKPSKVGRAKPESSIHIGTTLVRDGKADAFVTAGNTGATLAIATLNTLKRINGVKRPALSSLVVLNDNPMLFIDIGANSDAKPEWLLQFAIMGSTYSRTALGLANPRVGMLSNGEEEGKGNEQIHAAIPLLHSSGLNFIGNVEPQDVLAGKVDVMVSDGFVGNIFIKTMEAFGSELFNIMRNEFKHDLRSKVGALLSKPALRRTYQQVDPFEIGGAPLLGVNGVVIIGHGRTNANGIKNAIRQARRAVEGKFIQAIQATFATEAVLETEHS